MSIAIPNHQNSFFFLITPFSIVLQLKKKIAIHTYWVSFRSFTGKKSNLINLITPVDS